MNAWRLLGACLVLVALSVGVSVHGQDKKDKPAAGKDTKKDKDTTKDKDAKKDKTGDTSAKKGDGDKLEWKAFDKEKSTFYQEMTTTTEQKMKVMQMEVLQTQKQTFYLQWTTDKVTDKEYTVKQKIIGVKMEIEIGGNKIDFDSTRQQQPANPLTDFFKALVGAEFKLTIDKKTLKVTKIDGQKEFVANLAKANPQLKSLLDHILSEKALEQMADPVFAVVPDNGKVPDGGTWDRKSTLDMGPIGTYDTVYKYKYGGTKGKEAKIGVTTELTYKPPTGKGNEGLPFKIMSADLKTKEPGTGEILFDTEKGRVASSTMTLLLTGRLTIEIAGMNTEVELNQKQDSTVKTMDTSPIPTK